MVHGIEQIRLKMDRVKKRMVVLEQVCNERDAVTPFGSFGPILLAALSISQGGSQRTNRSLQRWKGSNVSLSSRSLSVQSRTSSGCPSSKNKAILVDRLYALCRQLNAPTEFAELVGHHLLQVDLSSYLEMSKSTNQSATNKSNKSLVAFMAEMFQYCTRDFDLVAIAIDDVHLADELSWKVMQELFEAPSNCLIVCTCRPLVQYKLTIDPVFWGDLQSDHATAGKYTAIELKRLSKSETTEMIAKNMGISKELVDTHIQRSVFYQSWGIPQFVSVLLESMQKEELTIAESSFDEDDEEFEEESKSVLSSSENVRLNVYCLRRCLLFNHFLILAL
jgi:predicted ATPase